MIDLGDGLRLRPVALGDGPAFADAYRRNSQHLAPWDPLRAPNFATVAIQEQNVVRSVDERRLGRSSRFVITDGDRIVGIVNLNDIVRGAFESAHLGYWIDATLAGRGVMSRAVGHIASHAQQTLGLHRIQAATLVHNIASQRVLAHNGFTRIGLAPRYLKIAGEWQDHILFQRILGE